VSALEIGEAVVGRTEKVVSFMMLTLGNNSVENNRNCYQ